MNMRQVRAIEAALDSVCEHAAYAEKQSAYKDIAKIQDSFISATFKAREKYKHNPRGPLFKSKIPK